MAADIRANTGNLFFQQDGREKIATPVQKITDGKRAFYIKRDDLLPFSFGGNKARKAFLFFEEIDEGDYDYIVTYGTSSSNHCRVVSNLAASRGLPCLIIGPQEKSETTYNQKMMKLFGAEQLYVPVETVHDTIERELQRLRGQGYHPYFIQGGGHGNIGTQAYVNCYEEICQYEKENGIFFDAIFFASGTGTTQAGLVCGQLMHGHKREIVGISIARKNPRGRQIVIDSIKEYLSAKKISVAEENIEQATIFIDQYTTEGYGAGNPQIKNTILAVMRDYGIPMDFTYVGKAFYGMQQYLQKNQITGKNILFLHTGGTPLFFDFLDRLDEFQ